VSRVRVGAIGAGWWATTNHLPLLAARDDVEIVSVCRPDADALRQVADRFGIPHATEDYRELLEQDLDAVLVCSPHHLHYEHTKAALQRGLHVLSEKPVALDPAHAWELAELADNNGVHVLVPYGWHYMPFTVAAHGILADGGVGEIQFVQCAMASPTRDFFAGTGSVPSAWTPQLVGPDPRTWQTPDQGGGYAHGQITHSSALMFWLTGLRAHTVAAIMTSPHSRVDLYDAAHVTFGSGAIGVLSGAATLPDDDKFQIDIRIFGTDGVLLLDVERERLTLRRHDGQHRDIPVPAGEGAYRCEAPPARFIDLITGASTENNSPLRVAAHSVELIAAMHRSAGQGGTPVRVTPPPPSLSSGRPAARPPHGP
jgi:predicted dehydrogenase